jgi:hypothetical protein
MTIRITISIKFISLFLISSYLTIFYLTDLILLYENTFKFIFMDIIIFLHFSISFKYNLQNL